METTTSTIIRSLKSDDIAAVAEIAAESNHNSWTQRVFEDCLKAEYQSWVMLDDEKITGFVIALFQHSECQLMNIGVLNECRRQGIARRLVEKLIRYSRAEHLQRISLEVRESNEAAIALYQSLGFSAVGTRKQYYPTAQGREDAVIFFLNI